MNHSCKTSYVAYSAFREDHLLTKQTDEPTEMEEIFQALLPECEIREVWDGTITIMCKKTGRLFTISESDGSFSVRGPIPLGKISDPRFVDNLRHVTQKIVFYMDEFDRNNHD